MFIMYVDESGDPGLTNSPTDYYALCGVVVHEHRWRAILDQLIAVRRSLRDGFGLKLREEVHCARMFTKPGRLARIPKHDRLSIIRQLARQVGSMTDLNLIPVVVDKRNKSSGYDVVEAAWTVLVQRFENTLQRKNFRPAHQAEHCGVIFSDDTDEPKVRSVMRRLRRYNAIPNQEQWGEGYRNLPLGHIVEDPTLRNSAHSLFVQVADLATFLVYQYLCPSAYFRKKGARSYYKHLAPILCRAAVPGVADGIKRL